FQSTSGSVRRTTPPRRMGAGWIAPSLKGEVSNHKGNFDEKKSGKGQLLSYPSFSKNLSLIKKKT
ncbi:MAG: hypothetical protein LBH65_05225, partial [Desulfovibrio sp.]|nr:hypothetical protein [Desulfovibrio sp.]